MFTPDILLPGPTPIPLSIQQAMLTPMSDHRADTFAPILKRAREALGRLFGIDQNGGIAIVPASGTGALEAAVQNFFEPGDAVLSVSVGAFGDRFRDIARAHGLAVDAYAVPWGQAFDPHAIMSHMAERPYLGILLTHNETSTGVLNPIKEMAHLLSSIPGDRRPLIIVDSISGVPAVPLTLADWNVDVVLAASQKGFMCPPGLALIGASSRALRRLQSDRSHRFYFDLHPYFAGGLPYTPATSLVYGLDRSLDLLKEEGSGHRYRRHALLGQMTRAFGLAAGWLPLVPAHIASPTVTALALPDGVSPNTIRSHLARMGLQVAGGMGPWHQTAIRIGHVGAITPASLFAGLGVMAHLTPSPIEGLDAAWNVWHENIDQEEVRRP